MAKPRFENREDSIVKNTSFTFGLSEVNRKKRKRKLLALKLLNSENPLIATSVEEMNPVVAVKMTLHAEINQK